MEYFNWLNETLYNIMPTKQKKVLEFGCGSGKLGEHYKKANIDTKYFGIELDPNASKLAKQNIDFVLNGDVENIPSNHNIKENDFDMLVYGDILEHLKDPWNALSEHTKLLKENGYVCASIPNASHISIIEGLLNGDWQYTSAGLLDKTHLRFFTLRTIHQLFSQANLKLIKIVPTYNSTKVDEELLSKLCTPEILDKYDRNIEQAKFEMRAYQYICLAQKQSIT